MDYRRGSERLAAYRRQIAETRARMRGVQRDLEPEPVADHVFVTTDGEVRLSELFGAKDDLFVIHNMGRSCPYCTLWADGYNGAYPHLASRAAFVVASPDPPEVQRKFAEGRGWGFPMVSDTEKRFATAMGYIEDGEPMPGVSVFKRGRDGIVRVADTGFGPGDDFCAVYHFFDLMPEGAGGWSPKLRYG